MQWAENHLELRNDPRLLLGGARSVIVVALNYYPNRFQPKDAPQFAYYAYGEDYHRVLRKKMKQLAHFITKHEPQARCRVCVDSAPLRERYWARLAGVGFVGANNTLILPGRGSYFFIGILLTTLPLTADEPCTITCGDCGACVKACPTAALRPGVVDARRCLSCLTIEHKGDLPEFAKDAMGSRVYGCDTCQQVCPHNRHAAGHHTPELNPTDNFLALTKEKILTMTSEDFNNMFAHSAVKRAGLESLRRNAIAIKNEI